MLNSNPARNGAPTGCCDENGIELHVGQKVMLLNQTGDVTFECGAYGIAFSQPIDWAAFEAAIPATTHSRNPLHACFNDNFISFWEIIWNFNAEDDVMPNVKLVEKP